MFVTLYSSLFSFNYIIKIPFVLNNDTILPLVSMILSMMIYDFIFHYNVFNEHCSYPILLYFI